MASSTGVQMPNMETEDEHHPLFNIEVGRAMSIQGPHTTWFNYQTWAAWPEDAKFYKKLPFQGKPLMVYWNNPEPITLKLTEKDVNYREDTTSEAVSSDEGENNTAIYKKLEPIMKDYLIGPNVKICKYVLLGMGSVYSGGYKDDVKKDTTSATTYAQYMMAYKIIHWHQHLLDEDNPDRPRQDSSDEVEILIDSPHLNTKDSEHLSKFFKIQGGKVNNILYAPLPTCLELAKSEHALVITFVPNNSVRQMLNDYVLQGKKVSPAAIICATSHIDNKAPNGFKKIADLTNKYIVKWLAEYDAHPLTVNENFQNKPSPFGETSIHVHKGHVRLVDDKLPREGPQTIPGLPITEFLNPAHPKYRPIFYPY
jgi:hypothetical protein